GIVRDLCVLYHFARNRLFTRNRDNIAKLFLGPICKLGLLPAVQMKSSKPRMTYACLGKFFNGLFVVDPLRWDAWVDTCNNMMTPSFGLAYQVHARLVRRSARLLTFQ